MNKNDSIDEEFVSHVWDRGHFTKDNLRAKDGRRIKLISRGQRNDDSGADFQNAEIRIGGQLQKGDVEIHVKNSHWRAHRHDTNPRYNDTILHVAMWDDSISLLTRKQNGEYIPTLVLCEHLDRPIGMIWRSMEDHVEKPAPCRIKAESISSDDKGRILDKAGIERFNRKIEIFERKLGKNSPDQVLYSQIMEALGYSRNREPFRELAQKIPLPYLLDCPSEEIQAILLGVAGLLPSENNFDAETEEYLSRIEALWSPHLPDFEGRLMTEDQWEFFSIRPENFPTRRIAGMSLFLSNCPVQKEKPDDCLTETFISAFSDNPKESIRRLRAILMPDGDSYWSNRYTFGGKQFPSEGLLIGQNRADDIIINVILPASANRASQSKSRKLRQRIMAVYANYGRLQDNRITRYVAGLIFNDSRKRRLAINSAMRQQGLIHIYRNFCSACSCHGCPLI